MESKPLPKLMMKIQAYLNLNELKHCLIVMHWHYIILLSLGSLQHDTKQLSKINVDMLIFGLLTHCPLQDVAVILKV